MSKRFEGQVAWVTGGADGLGKGIGTRLASEGASVVLLDNDKQKLAYTIDGLQQQGFNAVGEAADIGDEEQVAAIFSKVRQQLGKLDVLVNSAGIVGPTSTPITQYETDAFDAIYRVNLRGAFLITKYGIPLMQENGYGRVLLIASIAGKEGNPFMVGYSTMKAGVIGLVKGVAK